MPGIVTFGCVLRSGGDYTEKNAQALQYSVKKHTNFDIRFICLSDIDIPGVETISLKQNNHGWWSVPEIFRLTGPVVVTGLDTVFVSNIDQILQLAQESSETDFWMIRGFNPKNRFASGIMAWNGDWKWIYDNFDFAIHSKKFTGEQDYTKAELSSRNIKISTIQEHVTGIYSYKLDICKLGYIPGDAKAILFHGKPRPHELDKKWIKENYPT